MGTPKNRRDVVAPNVKVIPCFSANETRIVISFGHSGKTAEIILQDSFTESGRGDFGRPKISIYEVSSGVYVSLASNVPHYGGETTEGDAR